jgi:hypothetical protein
MLLVAHLRFLISSSKDFLIGIEWAIWMERIRKEGELIMVQYDIKIECMMKPLEFHTFGF